jgi:hypothetical protein
MRSARQTKSWWLCLAFACVASRAGAQVTTRPLPEWTLAAAPTLDIGDDASVQTQFDGVTGVMRMPAGEIVVANSRSQELRLFSSSGRYIRTLDEGRATADRPRDLGRLWRSGDTIIVVEETPAESNVRFYTTSRFVAKRQVGSSNAGSIRPLDRFPDGRLVITAAPRQRQSPRPDIVFTDSAPLGVLSLDDRSHPRWIGTLANEMYIFRGVGMRGRLVAPVPYPLGRATRYAVSGGLLWVGDTETGQITQYDPDGRKRAQFTAPIAPRPLDVDRIRRLRSRLLDDAMNWNDRARVDAGYSLPLPAIAPRFARFLPGTGGEMWIELFAEDPAAPRQYLVVDRAGRAIGRVSLPPATTPFEIGPNYVLGVRTDAEGLEHIVQHAMTRR